MAPAVASAGRSDDLRQAVSTRYLNALDFSAWDDEDPRLDFGPAALPYFVEAFGRERQPERRGRLVRVIWQFREPAAVATLATALRDEAPDRWKEALDGLVCLGGPEAVDILRAARSELTADTSEGAKCEWIDEAIRQVNEAGADKRKACE